MARLYVKQRHKNDCGVAALAMAVNQPYEVIETALGAVADLTQGLNDLHLKYWLEQNGWAWVEVFINYPRRGKYVQRAVWPPKPFAPVHIVLLQATRDWHYVVLDGDGTLYDPWDESRDSLSHPDYKMISCVIGLWKVRA